VTQKENEQMSRCDILNAKNFIKYKGLNKNLLMLLQGQSEIHTFPLTSWKHPWNPSNLKPLTLIEFEPTLLTFDKSEYSIE